MTNQMPSVSSFGNWIPDRNRFSLPTPPDWFLKVLWDQDAGLVLIPSRQQRKYIVGRRRELSRKMFEISSNVSKQLAADTTQTDAGMCDYHKLVPVDSITGNVYAGSWMRSCPTICQSFRDRDMWAAGGAEAYVAKLEAEEQGERDRIRAKTVDDIDHRARDAWRSYQARTGQRTRVGNGPSRTSRAKIVQVGTL